MRPNEEPYDAMEYNYPYPPRTMPPTSWVGPAMGWPPTEAGEDYTPEIFWCFAYYCCCGSNLSGPIKVYCSYPIITGPWVKNNDGSTCTTQSEKIDETQASICLNPCGNGNCPPDVRVMVKSYPQSPKGKKKYPGQIKEMKVTMISECGKVGNPPCPPVSACCTGVSISGQPQMNVGTSQTLTVLNPVTGCSYEFRTSGGSGTIKMTSATTATFTAPSSNPGCVNNATVNLYDKTNCVICASITIAITNPAVTGVAYRKRVCGCGGMACTSYDYSDNWGCDGVMYPRVGVCLSGWFCGCDNSGTPYSQSHMEPGWNPYPVGDIRTPEMKAQGCCPANPL
jgi:hypothetical protein